ncbi:MAG: S41 family peptidase [bacterium]|nr:S41 family peptidase [bacterium]
MRPHLKKYLLGYLAVILILGSFIIGYGTGIEEGKKNLSVTVVAPGENEGTIKNKDEKPPAYLSKDVDFRLFWDVWKLVKDRYVDTNVPDTQIFYGALSGLLTSLKDPYSTFLDPEINQKFSEELSGSFEGVGMEIGSKHGQLVVVAPLPGTPASRAGLRAGDKILAIDKFDTMGIAVDYAVSKIRGKGGTAVVLSVHRNEWPKPKDISLVRERISIPSARLEMKGDIAYVKLTHFNADTTEKFRKVVNDLLLKNPKSIVFDMRNNAGGFLDTAVDVAGEWVEDGVLVTEKLRQGEGERTHEARGRARLKDMKTVVLVNEGSASAAEIVAGALKDYNLATLIGKKTFGKGSVQELENLPDGSAVKITVAKWYTPKGTSIDQNGITPDIEIDLKDEDYENDRDPQLDAAIKFLHGEKVESQKEVK